MKKLMYVLAGVFLAAAITSCEKVKENPQGVLVGSDGILKGKPVAVSSSGGSGPVSEAGATPYVIPGENNGGNRTCEEARTAFDIMADTPGHEFEGLTLGEFINCGEKVDIPEGEVGLISGFPFDVWVDDHGAIKFNTGYRDCVVSAVIVKGGNKANVYYYPHGATEDEGLAAPMLKNGKNAWVSNVTFCCECGEDAPEEVITVKVKLTSEDYGTSEGAHPFTVNWCQSLGISPFVWGTTYNIYLVYTDNIIGTMTIAADGSSVTIDMNDDLTIDYTDLFVGTMDELYAAINPDSQCPIEGVSPWIHDDTDGNVVVIPL